MQEVYMKAIACANNVKVMGCIWSEATAEREVEVVALQEVVVVSVPVSDQDRAKAFYVDTLGFEVVKDDSMPGLRWVQVAPTAGGTSLTLVTWFDSMPAGSLQGLVLTSNDLQADYEQLVVKGVEFDQPPTQRPWATEAVFRDADGNTLVLQQA